MNKFTDRILHIIYMTRCVFCDSFMPFSQLKICEKCLESLPYQKKYCRKCGKPLDTVFGDSICPKCKKTSKPYDRVYVPLLYKDNVRCSILRFKYEHKRSYAKMYAYMIFIQLKKEGYFPDAITYVPIHRDRFKVRGYNQTKLVADNLSKLFNVPCVKLLRKCESTPPLAKLSASMRQKIVKGSYGFVKRNIKNKKNILLVDDIITTSSTATECAKIIKENYDVSVSVATIAATPFQ